MTPEERQKKEDLCYPKVLMAIEDHHFSIFEQNLPFIFTETRINKILEKVRQQPQWLELGLGRLGLDTAKSYQYSRFRFTKEEILPNINNSQKYSNKNAFLAASIFNLSIDELNSLLVHPPVKDFIQQEQNYFLNKIMQSDIYSKSKNKKEKFQFFLKNDLFDNFFDKKSNLLTLLHADQDDLILEILSHYEKSEDKMKSLLEKKHVKYLINKNFNVLDNLYLWGANKSLKMLIELDFIEHSKINPELLPLLDTKMFSFVSPHVDFFKKNKNGKLYFDYMLDNPNIKSTQYYNQLWNIAKNSGSPHFNFEFLERFLLTAQLRKRNFTWDSINQYKSLFSNSNLKEINVTYQNMYLQKSLQKKLERKAKLEPENPPPIRKKMIL